MKQIKLPLDIMISHDWPQGIYNFGDVDTLVRKKQHFKEQVEPGTRTPLGR
jgi:lariat debranching enzyme